MAPLNERSDRDIAKRTVLIGLALIPFNVSMLWIVVSEMDAVPPRSTVLIAVVAGLIVGVSTEPIARFGARTLTQWQFITGIFVTAWVAFVGLVVMNSTLFIPRPIVVALIIGVYALIVGGVLASVGRAFVWPRVAPE